MKIYIEGTKRAAVSRMFPVWEGLGHTVINDINNCDIRLSVVRMTDKKIPTVLRIDGVYYDKELDYVKKNGGISRSHSMADAVIYQSKLSKLMCERFLSERKGSFQIIHNGIDRQEWFNPTEHSSINIVCCSKWRRIKRLPEIIQIFNKFLEVYPDAKLHVVGPMKRGAQEIPNKNVIYYGQLDFVQIKKLYQVADVCLHITKKDSCPSSVIEAIGAGIPVVTTNACGGTVELCDLTKGCGIVSGEVESTDPDFIYQEAYNKLSNKIQIKIVQIMVDVVKNKIQVDLPKELMIETVARQYLDVFKSVIGG